MTTPYDPTENAIDAAVQREIDRYHTSRTATCDVCGWQWRKTLHPTLLVHLPVECPACERQKRMADLNRVCNVNSDLKGK